MNQPSENEKGRDRTQRGGCLLCRARWSPHAVGVAIGVLSIAVFGVVNNPLGMPTGIAQASGACASLVAGPDAVSGNAYCSSQAKPARDYNFIVNQFRLRDSAVVKIMLTAVVVGGIGVAILNGSGLANWHIKPADLLAVALGAVLFGAGMAICGYCPGTGLAAVGTGSLHAPVAILRGCCGFHSIF